MFPKAENPLHNEELYKEPRPNLTMIMFYTVTAKWSEQYGFGLKSFQSYYSVQDFYIKLGRNNFCSKCQIQNSLASFIHSKVM